MSRRLNGFMVLALCALAQSVSSNLVKNDLLDLNSPYESGEREMSAINKAIYIDATVLVSIPPSQTGSAQIVSSALTMSPKNPCLFIIIAEEICNKPSNTSDPCTSLNKEPELIVTLTSMVNFGKPQVVYRTSVTGGELVLTIDMKEDLVVMRKYNPEPKNTTIYLNFRFESYELRKIEKNANSLDVVVNVETNTLPSGQSGLSPLHGTILLLLLAVFLFN